MHAHVVQSRLSRQAGPSTSLINRAHCTINAALQHIKYYGATDHAASAIGPVWTEHYFVQLHQHDMRLSGRIVQVTYFYALFPPGGHMAHFLECTLQSCNTDEFMKIHKT